MTARLYKNCCAFGGAKSLGHHFPIWPEGAGRGKFVEWIGAARPTNQRDEQLAAGMRSSGNWKPELQRPTSERVRVGV